MKPEVSLIIPTFNEEKHISKLIDSLLKQRFSKKFEVIIVDGASEDNTKAEVQKYAKKVTEFDLKCVDNPKRRTPFAFNIGIENCSGKYFAIVGAHSVLDKNWLQKSYDTIVSAELNVMGVGGRWINESHKTGFTESVAYATSSFLGGGTSTYRYSKKPQYVNTVVYGMYKKVVVEKVGNFDTNFLIGQDGEFNFRIIDAGYKLFFNPDIIAHYKVRSSVGKFVKQMYHYGKARSHILLKLRHINVLQMIPGFFVLYLFSLPFIGFFYPIYLVPLILYILLVLTFSLGKIRYFLWNVLVFLVIHSVYGFGEVVGFVQRVFLGRKVTG